MARNVPEALALRRPAGPVAQMVALRLASPAESSTCQQQALRTQALSCPWTWPSAYPRPKRSASQRQLGQRPLSKDAPEATCKASCHGTPQHQWCSVRRGAYCYGSALASSWATSLARSLAIALRHRPTLKPNASVQEHQATDLGQRLWHGPPPGARRPRPARRRAPRALVAGLATPPACSALGPGQSRPL